MAFLLFLWAGYLSPNRWLMLISLSDVSVLALVIMICKGRSSKWVSFVIQAECNNKM